MKVLHLRIDSLPGYRSDAIEKGFRELGFDYIGFNWQPYRFEYGTEKLRQQVVDLSSQTSPDIIFAHIQNPEIFELDTWEQLSKHGFVINYTFDVRQPEKQLWLHEVAKIVGHTFFACDRDVLNCHQQGIKNVSAIHSSCDMDLFRPSVKRNLYALDIAFVGNRYDNTNLDFPMDGYRQEMIEIISGSGWNFMPYGLGKRGGLIRPEQESNVYNFSKICINQNNFYLHGYTSDRLWRIMAAGAFCLTQHFPGIEKIFERGVHLDWFENFDEMIDLIKKYLSNEQERNEIARIGSNYVRENHTWKNRIEEMLKVIEPVHA